MRSLRHALPTRSALAAATSLLLLASAVSCAHPLVVDEDRLEWVNTKQTETIHSFLWGLWRAEIKLAEAPDPTRGERPIHGGTIHHVSFRQSYLDSLAAILTLGIWMPGQVEWALSAPDVRPTPGAHRRQHTFEVAQPGTVVISLSSENLVSFEIKEAGSASSLPASDDVLVSCHGLSQAGGYVAECHAGLSPGSYLIHVEADRASATYDLLIEQGGTTLRNETNQKIDPLG